MKTIVGPNGIKAPSGFWLLTPAGLKEISNGCGPKGFDWLVPDRFRLLGINFGPACDVHDYMYRLGFPKKDADNLFLENMLTIAGRAFFLVRPIAEHMAFLYYLAVKNCGGAAYRNAAAKSGMVLNGAEVLYATADAKRDKADVGHLRHADQSQAGT